MSHLDEASLLEKHYLPDAGSDGDAHLADCAECRTRYEAMGEGIDASVSQHAALVDRKPETFWARQRIAISRRIESGEEIPERISWSARSLLAAAAVLVVVVAGTAIIYRNAVEMAPTPGGIEQSPVLASNGELDLYDDDADELSVALFEDAPSHDPWSSEEISDFHQVVEWESWLADDITDFGGTS